MAARKLFVVTSEGRVCDARRDLHNVFDRAHLPYPNDSYRTRNAPIEFITRRSDFERAYGWENQAFIVHNAGYDIPLEETRDFLLSRRFEEIDTLEEAVLWLSAS